jgi:hypothetical protein
MIHLFMSSFFPCLFTYPFPTDTSLHPRPQLVSFPFQLESSSESALRSRPSQQQSHLSQEFNAIPSTDVIDVPKLARQDQPPPAYENVDERPPSIASRASRPLPRPPINRLGSGSSMHSVGLLTDAVQAGPHETAHLSPQSSSSPSNYIDPMLSTGHAFSSPAGPSQSPAVSVGLSHLDPSSQDRLDRCSAGISPSPQSLFNTLPPRMVSEAIDSQQFVSSSAFDHDATLWTPNQSLPDAQQEMLASSVSSRPISSSGSIQTLSPPPPYSPPEASSSRTGHPLSEHPSDMRSTHRPRPALPPPAPPTILDPPPARSTSVWRSRAPHEPYLSDAPPPPDSWIAVETSPVEYRLVARLPGFRRDAMYVMCFVLSACSLRLMYLERTLAARRRRVLHVVADSWEPGGGT